MTTTTGVDGPENVIAHFHLFKNAGCTVDYILHNNFRERFVRHDLATGSRISGRELLDFIAARPGIKAVSSHQILFPLPARPGVRVFPLFFLRHPVDRVLSAYHFGCRFGSRPAARFDLKGFIEYKLAAGRGIMIRNFHVLKLSDILYDAPDSKSVEAGEIHFRQAKCRIMESPFFGMVEHFDESLLLMRRYLEGAFPGFDCTHKIMNEAPGRKANLDDRIEDLRRSIGESLYQTLLDHNRYDLELYAFARSLFFERVRRAVGQTRAQGLNPGAT